MSASLTVTARVSLPAKADLASDLEAALRFAKAEKSANTRREHIYLDPDKVEAFFRGGTRSGATLDRGDAAETRASHQRQKSR